MGLHRIHDLKHFIHSEIFGVLPNMGHAQILNFHRVLHFYIWCNYPHFRTPPAMGGAGSGLDPDLGHGPCSSPRCHGVGHLGPAVSRLQGPTGKAEK